MKAEEDIATEEMSQKLRLLQEDGDNIHILTPEDISDLTHKLHAMHEAKHLTGYVILLKYLLYICDKKANIVHILGLLPSIRNMFTESIADLLTDRVLPAMAVESLNFIQLLVESERHLLSRAVATQFLAPLMDFLTNPDTQRLDLSAYFTTTVKHRAAQKSLHAARAARAAAATLTGLLRHNKSNRRLLKRLYGERHTSIGKRLVTMMLQSEEFGTQVLCAEIVYRTFYRNKLKDTATRRRMRELFSCADEHVGEHGGKGNTEANGEENWQSQQQEETAMPSEDGTAVSRHLRLCKAFCDIQPNRFRRMLREFIQAVNSGTGAPRVVSVYAPQLRLGDQRLEGAWLDFGRQSLTFAARTAGSAAGSWALVEMPHAALQTLSMSAKGRRLRIACRREDLLGLAPPRHDAERGTEGQSATSSAVGASAGTKADACGAVEVTASNLGTLDIENIKTAVEKLVQAERHRAAAIAAGSVGAASENDRAAGTGAVIADRRALGGDMHTVGKTDPGRRISKKQSSKSEQSATEARSTSKIEVEATSSASMDRSLRKRPREKEKRGSKVSPADDALSSSQPAPEPGLVSKRKAAPATAARADESANNCSVLVEKSSRSPRGLGGLRTAACERRPTTPSHKGTDKGKPGNVSVKRRVIVKRGTAFSKAALVRKSLTAATVTDAPAADRGSRQRDSRVTLNSGTARDSFGDTDRLSVSPPASAAATANTSGTPWFATLDGLSSPEGDTFARKFKRRQTRDTSRSMQKSTRALSAVCDDASPSAGQQAGASSVRQGSPAHASPAQNGSSERRALGTGTEPAPRSRDAKQREHRRASPRSLSRRPRLRNVREDVASEVGSGGSEKMTQTRQLAGESERRVPTADSMRKTKKACETEETSTAGQSKNIASTVVKRATAKPGGKIRKRRSPIVRVLRSGTSATRVAPRARAAAATPAAGSGKRAREGKTVAGCAIAPSDQGRAAAGTAGAKRRRGRPRGTGKDTAARHTGQTFHGAFSGVAGDRNVQKTKRKLVFETPQPSETSTQLATPETDFAFADPTPHQLGAFRQTAATAAALPAAPAAAPAVTAAAAAEGAAASPFASTAPASSAGLVSVSPGSRLRIDAVLGTLRKEMTTMIGTALQTLEAQLLQCQGPRAEPAPV